MNTQQNQSSYSQSLINALIQTGVVALVVGVVCDEGRTMGATVAALFAYWMIATTIWLREGEVHQHEIVFAKYGVVAILFTAIATLFIWNLFA